MIVIPDNYDQFVAHDAAQYEAERRRPKCDCCGEAIWTEDAYYLGGSLYCENCVDKSRIYIDDIYEEDPDC